MITISRCIQRAQKYYLKLGSYGLTSEETFSFLGLFSVYFSIHSVAALFPIEILGMGDSTIGCKYPIILISFTGDRQVNSLISVANQEVFRGLVGGNWFCFYWVRGLSEGVLPEVLRFWSPGNAWYLSIIVYQAFNPSALPWAWNFLFTFLRMSYNSSITARQTRSQVARFATNIYRGGNLEKNMETKFLRWEMVFLICLIFLPLNFR